MKEAHEALHELSTNFGLAALAIQREVSNYAESESKVARSEVFSC